MFKIFRQPSPRRLIKKEPRSLAVEVLACSFSLYNLLIIVMYDCVIISMLTKVREVGRVNTLEELLLPRNSHLRLKVTGGNSPVLNYLRGHPVYPQLKHRIETVTYRELPQVVINKHFSRLLKQAFTSKCLDTGCRGNIQI